MKYPAWAWTSQPSLQLNFHGVILAVPGRVYIVSEHVVVAGRFLDIGRDGLVFIDVLEIAAAGHGGQGPQVVVGDELVPPQVRPLAQSVHGIHQAVGGRQLPPHTLVQGLQLRQSSAREEHDVLVAGDVPERLGELTHFQGQEGGGPDLEGQGGFQERCLPAQRFLGFAVSS